ncbi:hypothetical protein [Bacillus toyonensis]|uniref:hypothetical protein n=1 Tax=Bacillus toyonensis TaxID=155322 RepID=UPI002E1F5638|nr:hypothetical protein [Bacillus toyonensis]
MNFKNVIENLNQTPVNKWIKTDYKAPDLLTEIYGLVVNSIEELIEQVIEPGEKRELSKKQIESNLFAAGGYISDFIFSKVHNTPFTPKDIDIFLNNEWLSEILIDIVKQAQTEIPDDVNFNVEEVYNNIFGKKLKQHFPDCKWEDKSEDAYNFTFVNKIFRFTYKGTAIELILANENRVLTFDVSFRLAYYSKGFIFINEMGLEDIQSKTLRIINTYTPISTLVRIYDFSNRFGLEIDSLSLMLLLESVTDLRIPQITFLDRIRSHKKYTPEIEKEILHNKHTLVKEQQPVKWYDSNKNMTVETNIIITFPIEHFPEFREDFVFYYKNLANITRAPLSVTYKKAEYFLKNMQFDEMKFIRPANWFSNEIFKKGIDYGTTYEEWMNSLTLSSIFGEKSVPYETLQIIEDAVLHNKDSITEEYKSAVEKLPVIAKSNEFNLTLDWIDFEALLLANIFQLKLEDPNGTNYIHIHIDTYDETITIGKLSPLGTYFGFVGNIYESFVEQLKSNLGLVNYSVVTDFDDTALDSYSGIVHELENITPAKLLIDAINHK